MNARLPKGFYGLSNVVEYSASVSAAAESLTKLHFLPDVTTRR